MPLTFAAPTPESIPLHIVEPGGLENWLLDRSEAETAWVRLNGFTGKIGQTLLVPTEGGATLALAGFGTAKDRARTRYALAAAAAGGPLEAFRALAGAKAEAWMFCPQEPQAPEAHGPEPLLQQLRAVRGAIAASAAPAASARLPGQRPECLLLPVSERRRIIAASAGGAWLLLALRAEAAAPVLDAWNRMFPGT